jgi:lysophospholipase L1-like esterase
MKTLRLFLFPAIAICLLPNTFGARTGALLPATSAATVRTNTAIVPAPPSHPKWRERAEAVLRRAKDHPGNYDLVFVCDSITEFWENSGANVWQRYYAGRKCLNLGVSGDRTQCVLWRFDRGQLENLKPKVVVLLIGTNNSSNDDNTAAEMLEGIQAVVAQLRARLPASQLLVLGIFPRGETFSPQRGKIVQVNQALARLTDARSVHYLDIGSQLIERDGSISRAVMPDYLHLSEHGYELWAAAMEPKIRQLLGE